MKKLRIVTAPRNGGKTTWIWDLFLRIKQSADTKAGGFITRLPGESDDKSEFILVNIETGEECVVASENPPVKEDGWRKLGRRYFFSSQVFETAYKLYKECGDYTHLFMDEAGPLELQGYGFDSAIRYLESEYHGTLIITVRDIFIEDFLAKYKFSSDWDIEIEGPSFKVEKTQLK